MDKNLIIRLKQKFEDYANEKDGIEFWFARDLQKLLDYSD
jgi:DNA-damage-inducible protein D